jgi:hypothetical protein
MRYSDEQALRAARVEQAATARLLASLNAQGTIPSGSVGKTAKPREAKVADVYRIAAAQKLQVLSADVESDAADASSFTIDLRIRGAYPDAKKLVSQVLAGDGSTAVRIFSVRRLASGVELEMRVLFEVRG